MPDGVKLGDILDKTDIKKEDKDTYGSAFSELLRHINNSGVFYKYNKEGCWYISYILHKEVERFLRQDYNLDVYKLLQEFILKYNKHNSQRSDRCMNDFVYIDSDTFKIMNALYTLYDEYTKIKPYYKRSIPYNCENFSKFIHSYNSFLNNHVSGTDFFNNILKHFDTEVRDAISKYSIIECKQYPYHANNLNLYTPPKPKDPIPPVQLEQRQTANVLTTTELQNSHHDVAHEQDTQAGEVLRVEAENQIQVAKGERGIAHNQQITRDYAISPEPGRVFKPGEAHNPEISRGHGMTHDNRRTYNRGREEEVWRTGLSTYSQDTATLDSSSQLELSDVSTFSPKLDGKTEDDGVFANVRSTITNVLGSVDPVPVVGVSGGMGALFLLFRYTPFGTFFRGGRGRVHRIPRSFNGPFLGEFQGYQDYYGGNIGYGQMNPLAE
ncbi:variable surface protein Vir6, putative [Plasmodium vivax]|uniref:Variable surface protein Vir6, putative n=1 Tax=Plasmodium vivax (strain Salvador I) TaxID=126793 RepID=A5KDF2_PLAVS|nr:variable surface protein Vir6, putative [Plasmodium vivax]EDL42617.1 variable surface protein Vir6, putative [Plasmodium vivax]|eukprot:XP_001612410.1 variable surface protein Vir6 [Plasmodium vivax Sal-1]